MSVKIVGNIGHRFRSLKVPKPPLTGYRTACGRSGVGIGGRDQRRIISDFRCAGGWHLVAIVAVENLVGVSTHRHGVRQGMMQRQA